MARDQLGGSPDEYGAGAVLSVAGRTGDITLATSDVTGLVTALAGKQTLNSELTALAGLTSAANQIPYFTGLGMASLLGLDTDSTFAANSDTKVPSQKAVKTAEALKAPLAGPSFTGKVSMAGTLTGIPTVSSLPGGTPDDGAEIYYVADATNGVVWHFKYRSASGSGSKWEFIGGPPLFAEVPSLGDEGTSSGTYVALTTAGPVISLPLAGDYMVAVGHRGYNVTNTSGVAMSYDIGGTGAVDADAAVGQVATGSHSSDAMAIMYERRKNGLTAVTLTAKYKAITSGTALFSKRWMRVSPVRVG